MISPLLYYVNSNWKKFPSLQKAPGRVDVLGVAGSQEGGTTTFLLFAENMKLPFGVVRLARQPVWEGELKKEWDTLGVLKDTLLRACVPLPIFYEVFAGVHALGESVLEGTPMQVRSGSGGMPAASIASNHFRLALDWLVVLHKETEKPSDQEAVLDQIKKDIEKCGEVCSLSFQERKLLAEIIGADTLVPHLKRSFIVHGDFVPHNMMVAKDSLCVIDWIAAKRSPFGCFDMFSFGLVYALHARKTGGLQGYIKAFSDAFLSNNDFSNIIASSLREYAERMGIEVSRIRAWFAFFLVMKANEEHDRHLPLAPHSFIRPESIWIHFIKRLLKEKDCFIVKDLYG